MIRKPKRLKQRPHWKGLPIPYIAVVKPDGEPDFRVTDEERRRSVLINRQCQLCGDQLGKWFFFVGGVEAAKHNNYFEPACHLDCLIYAMQVCPFIAGKMQHAEVTEVAADNPTMVVKADDAFSPVKSSLWVIKKAIAWSYIKTPQGTILVVPTAVRETEPLKPEEMSATDWQRVQEELQRA